MADELGLPSGEIKPAETFLSYGMNPLQAMMLVGDLEGLLGRSLPPTLVWDHPSIEALALHVIEQAAAEPVGSAANGAPRVNPSEAEDLLARLDQLSDEYINTCIEILQPSLARGSHPADDSEGRWRGPDEGGTPMAMDLTSLSPHEKRELLGRIQRDRASRGRLAPLTRAQEHLRMLLKLEPESPVYNITLEHHLAGPLDAEALGGAVRRVAARHEALRTTFAVAEGRPFRSSPPRPMSPALH